MSNIYDGSVWFPISPYLTPLTGAFAALSQFANADKLKPIALADSTKATAPILYEGERMLNRTDDLSVGVASIARVHGSALTKSYLSDTIFGWEQTVSSSEANGFIEGTIWGVGARLHLNVTQLSAEANVSAPASIAASVSLGFADATYEIQIFGIDGISLLGKLPGPGRFDAETYARWIDVLEEVRTQMVKTVPQDPLPLAISRTAAIETFDPKARAFVFAMMQVAQRTKGGPAVEKAKTFGLDPAVVQFVYEKELKLGTNWADLIDQSREIQAKEWLEQIKP